MNDSVTIVITDAKISQPAVASYLLRSLSYGSTSSTSLILDLDKTDVTSRIIDSTYESIKMCKQLHFVSYIHTVSFHMNDFIAESQGSL